MSDEKVSKELIEAVDNGRFPTPLPLKHSLNPGYLLSLLIVALTTMAALAGLFYTDSLYPTEELRQLALANDVITLLFGLPLLLAAMWLARRDHLIGLLLWPGAVFYGLYNYLVYILGMPFTVMYPVYLLIGTLSLYTLIWLAAGIDGGGVEGRVNGRLPAKLGGGVLIGFGVLFLLRTIGEFAQPLLAQTAPGNADLALLATDFITIPAWIIGGVLLWRKHAFGYVSGFGLLFQACMLFVGLLGIIALQPMLTGAPFLLGDFIFVLLMGMVCFAPFGLFVRTIVRRS